MSFLYINNNIRFILFYFIKYTFLHGWQRQTSQPSAVAVLEKATENQPTKIYFNVTKSYIPKTKRTNRGCLIIFFSILFAHKLISRMVKMLYSFCCTDLKLLSYKYFFIKCSTMYERDWKSCSSWVVAVA